MTLEQQSPQTAARIEAQNKALDEQMTKEQESLAEFYGIDLTTGAPVSNDRWKWSSLRDIQAPGGGSSSIPPPSSSQQGK